VPSSIVFFDIAGPDGSTLRTFYADVFGWRLDESGQFEASVAAPLGLFRDPAANPMGLVEMEGNRPKSP